MFHPLQLPVFLAIFICSLVAFYARQEKPSRGTHPFSWLMLSITWWAGCYLLELIQPRILWAQLAYVGIVFTGLTWVWFALEYVGYHYSRLGPWRWLPFIHPLVMLGLVFTNDYHHWVWQEVHITEADPLVLVEVTYGWAFVLHSVYMYSLLLVGIGLLLRASFQTHPHHQGQSWALLVAALAPMLGNLLYVLKLSYIDLTTVGFAITGLAMAFGIYRYQLFELLPIAREAIINSMGVGVLIVDENNIILDINAPAAAFTNHAPRDVVGKSIYTVYNDYRAWVDHFLHTEHDEAYNPATGQYFDVKVFPLRDEIGRLRGRILLIEDITPRKILENDLRRQALVFEHIADSVIITNLEGLIVDCNPATSTLFGYNKEELVGKRADIWHATGAYDRWMQGVLVAIQQTGQWQGEINFVRRDGTEGICEGVVLPLYDNQGKLIARIGVSRDIADRKAAEELLIQAKNQAEAANLAKSAFLANMSHELRTPLTAIIGYSELIESELGEVDVQSTISDLQKIQVAGKHLLDLIRDVLDLAKIEAGEIEIFAEMFTLADLMREIEVTVSYLVQRNNNTLTLVYPTDGAVMYSDHTKVRQILLNLIGNAAKFTQNGSIALSVEFDPDNTRMVIFHVSDTGIGIPPHKLEAIFGAFVQADASTTREYGGTGLGLTITSYYARVLGGRVHVVSEVGVGSTFSVTLPLRYQAPTD